MAYAVIGVTAAIRRLRKLGPAAERAASAAMSTTAREGAAHVKANVYGAPGPSRDSGQLQEDVRGVVHPRAGGAVAEIGADTAYGPRLEFGFYGTDILGRDYNQDPFPWLGPQIPAVAGIAKAALVAELKARF